MKCNALVKNLILASILTVFSAQASADAGVFTGNGQNLHPVTSKTIQLVSIDVTIVLGRGPYLFDGTVPGMDRAEYKCTFVLQNLSDNEEDVEIGFPVDSEFARGSKPDSANESQDWVLEYAFIARDQQTTYNVNFVRRTPQKDPGEFGSLFLWNMRFSPKQTKTLIAQYRIPMSMGLIPTTKDETARPAPGVFGQEFLNIGSLEMAGYITSTGASWAGNVTTAKFRLITGPFEKYFNLRGVIEDTNQDMNLEATKQFNSSFPVHHPFWFRQIEPEGWKPIEEGVEWDCKDYKPKDPLEVRYYTTPFPRLPQETSAFVRRFLMALGPAEPTAANLAVLRQVLLATWGKEPDDPSAKAYVAAQVWYKPRKDFSMADLTPQQRSVLDAFEKSVAQTKRK